MRTEAQSTEHAILSSEHTQLFHLLIMEVQISVGMSNIKFHQISYSGPRAKPCGETDRQDALHMHFHAYPTKTAQGRTVKVLSWPSQPITAESIILFSL